MGWSLQYAIPAHISHVLRLDAHSSSLVHTGGVPWEPGRDWAKANLFIILKYIFWQ